MLLNKLLRILIGLWLIGHSVFVVAGSKWQLPLSGLDASFVSLDRTWSNTTDFQIAWPQGSHLVVPQEGTLVFAGATGPLGVHGQGWIVRHPENLYSVLTASMPQHLFETAAVAGKPLNSGALLAKQSARFPAKADLRLDWRVLRLTEEVRPDDPLFLEKLARGSPVSTGPLLGMGFIQFASDNSDLITDLAIDVGGKRISGRDTDVHRYLVPEGVHALSVVWGGFFKKSSITTNAFVGGDGLLVHQIQKDPSGQWNVRTYDFILPANSSQLITSTPAVDERNRKDEAVETASAVVKPALVESNMTTSILNSESSAQIQSKDSEREAEERDRQQANLQKALTEELRLRQLKEEKLKAQKDHEEQIERQRLVAEAVDVERRKRLDLEQRLAAAETRERDRADAEAKERERERARLQAAPQVFASRKALVIGNDQYVDVPKLSNAVADADAMALALQAVGFNVFKHTNVDEKKFKLALRDFRMRLEPGDEVMIFFAGHGVQLNNANYLLPVDIKGENEEQIRDEAIQLQRVLDDLQDRRTKFALAVVDACRDNPFKGNGRAIGGRGLAPTTAATGQMILFSAGAGQQALDRLGKEDKERNGLFTRIFVKEMVKPGVSVDRVLRNVRNEVVRLAKTIGHDQTPALYDQAVGDFFFRQ